MPAAQQRQAIVSLLHLRDDIGLPDPRVTVPTMAHIATRHPKLNVLNLDAVAAATSLAATVWLSPETARGILPAVLDEEGLRWRTIAVR